MLKLFTIVLLLVQAIIFFAPGLAAGLWLQKNKGLKPLYVLLLAGLLGCSLGFGAFWLYLIHPVVGGWFSALLLLAGWTATLFLITNKEYRNLLRQPDILWPAALLLSVTLFYNAIFLGCQAAPSDPSCYTQGLPMDNMLPQIFASNVMNDNPKELFGNWLGSDRPPLQAGVILGQAPLTVTQFVGYNGYQLLASLLQCLWIPAVWALGRNLKLTSKQLALLLGLCIVTGFFFFNSVYVWPKLLAASLSVFAFCLLFFENRTRLNWLLAGAAIGAGLVAHSGIVFTLIPMAVLLLFKRFWPGWHMAVAAALAALVFVLPWLAYQNFYDPPGNQVVKLQLAGAASAGGQSLPKAVYESYTNASVGEIIGNKLSNVRTIFGYIPPDGALYGGGLLAKIRDADFKYVLLGLAVFNAGWIMLLEATIRKQLKKTLHSKRLWLMLGIALASLTAWALAMFDPNSTVIHQGSYLTMLLLFAGFGAIIAQLPGRLPWLLLGAQAAYFVVVWIVSILMTHRPSPSSLLLIGIGVAAVVWSLWKSRQVSLPKTN